MEDFGVLQLVNLLELFIFGEVRIVDEEVSGYIVGCSFEVCIEVMLIFYYKCGCCWCYFFEVIEDGMFCVCCDDVVEGLGVII